MAMVINGNNVTAEMENRGRIYKFDSPRVVALNGQGEAVASGYSTLTWVWDYLSDAEMDFWLSTVLGGARSKLCTGTTKLYNKKKVLTTFSTCVVHEPEYETFRNGYYINVTLRIENIA